MTKVKLETVCEILDSQRIPVTASERKKGIFPYYGANGLQDYVDDYIFDDELILLAEDGGNFNSKTKPIAYRVSGKCWVNNHAHVLKAKEGNDIDFICYALMFYDVRNLVKGATRKKLTQKDMRKMTIPLYSLQEQKEIALEMGRVSNLIKKRQEQLDKLDLLVKSKFFEMFGGVGENPYHYELCQIEKIADELFAGGDKPADSSFIQNAEYPYPVFSNGERENGLLCYAKIYRVDREAITISARGTIGYTRIRKPFFTPIVRLLTIVPKTVVNIVYLKQCIDSTKLTITGTSQGQLTLPEFKKIWVKLPPLERQNQFAEFVKKVETMKAKVKQSLEKLTTLKASYMQKYFG